MTPRVISEHERALTRQAMMNETKKLIAVKQGIKRMTVDDIVDAAGMAKGSFYSYFASKEACIYEVIAQAYVTDLIQLEAIMKMDASLAYKVRKFVDDVLLADGGIDRYIAPKDYEMLLRKLPPEYTARDEEAAEVTINKMMQLLKLGRVQVESVTVMFDCICNVAMQTSIPENVKEESIDALTGAITSYIEENSQNLEAVQEVYFAAIPMQDLLWLGGY